MTEKEKMILGLDYNANDPELLTCRKRSNQLCFEYNHTLERNKQKEIMNELIHVKNGCCIMPPFYCDYGFNIRVGDNFFANYNTVILDEAKVTFGDNVFVAPNCGFYTAGHPIDYKRRNSGEEYAKPITIGDNVWIGGGVQVMPGVTIGSDVVIGGGSVVVKDIPDHVVAAGNPCRVIRTIEEDE